MQVHYRYIDNLVGYILKMSKFNGICHLKKIEVLPRNLENVKRNKS